MMSFARRILLFVLLSSAGFRGACALANESDMRTVLVRVRSVNGNSITLDDKRGTVVKIGDKIKFINSRGRERPKPDVREGDEVVLFVDRQTQYIFKVSASPDDIEAVGGKPNYKTPDEGRKQTTDSPQVQYQRVEKSLTELTPIQGDWQDWRVRRNVLINGRLFETAGTMMVSYNETTTAVFSNSEGYDSFEAFIGKPIDRPDKAKIERGGRIRYMVSGDGKELFRSTWLREDDFAEKVNVSIKGYSAITLAAEFNWENKTNPGQAVWADPIFVKFVPVKTRAQVNSYPHTPSRPHTSAPFRTDEITIDLQTSPITVSVNGQSVDFGSAEPLQQAGRVLVPMRGVFEALGASVVWDAASHSLRSTRNGKNVNMTLGSRTAFVDGQPVQLDVPVVAYRGRIMVPLRFVAEALGVKVSTVR